MTSLAAGCGHVVDRIVKSGANYDPWDFYIIDGDDGSPIAGVQVDAVADLADDASGRTDRRGRVRLAVPTGVCEGVYATKDGYMPSPSLHPDWETLPRDKPIVIPLFREPPPRVGMILPADFRGLFRVREYSQTSFETERPTTTQPAPTRGRREFLITIDPTRVNELRRPPTMSDHGRHLTTYETRRRDGAPGKFQLDPTDILIYRFSDGTPLRLENPTMPVSNDLVFLTGVRELIPPRADGVAIFRLGVVYEGVGGGATTNTVYFVGTLEQATAAQRTLTSQAATAPSKSKTFRAIPLTIADLSTPR
jgi:hypothetical protein